MTPGCYCNSCGMPRISPTACVASVAFPGLALGRIGIAYKLWEQEKQLEVMTQESRKGVWCPIPSGPIKGTPCWCPEKPLLGCWSFYFYLVLII